MNNINNKKYIYTFFGEFGILNRYVIGLLEPILDKKKINILTVETYADILEAYFNKNLNIILPKNDIYISYRRGYHGNPITQKNFDIIHTVGDIAIDSYLCYTNSWLINSNFYQRWLLLENPEIPEKYNKSLYDIIKKKYPNRPWTKYCDETNILYDLGHDLLKNKTIQTGFTPRRPLYIKPISNNWIHIFAKKKPRNDKQFCKIEYYITICKIIRKLYPNKKIFCHGTMECMTEQLKSYIDYVPNNFEHSQNVLANAKLLICAFSGMGEFALNCKIKNLIYLKNGSRKLQLFYNPFNTNIYIIKPKNIEDTKKQIISILKKIF